MKTNITFYFDVSAGKYDSDGELNTKYCCTFSDAAQALAQYQYVSDYPWAQLDLCICEDGKVVRSVSLYGGDDPVQRPPWRQIKHAFDSGTLSWSEVFEALMSDCGMTMNGALQCIAEHFDRRPAIEGTEAV